MPAISTPATSEFYYDKTGTGPALVLIHGFPFAGPVWDAVRPALASSFTLIIPDLPGSGRSRLERPTGMEDMATCIKLALEAEGISRAVIAGHSMGGYVGCAFASLYPEALAGLSLVHSVPTADDEERLKARSKSIEIIRNGGKRQLMNQLIPNLFSDDFKRSDPTLVELLADRAVEADDESLINYYHAMMGRKDERASLRESGVPVQWIIGLKDNVIFYKKILELCYKSDINFVTFKKICGHMSMLESPESLVADLKEFTNYCYHYDTLK